jgi:hypothetical protein
MEPMAMVEAKSKLDILAKVRSPDILVMMIMTVNMASTESMTFISIGADANNQFSIILYLF